MTEVHIPALKIPPTISQLESMVTQNRSNKEMYCFILIDLMIKKCCSLLQKLQVKKYL